MSGAGNDFVVVDRTASGGLSGLPGLPELVRSMCDRRRGIGADGVIVLGPPAGADFTMEYFNADGSSGSLCGNGGRCASAYMMDRLGRDTVSFHACGREYRAERRGPGVVLGMDDPGPARLGIALRAGDTDLVGHFIDTGSPHLVIIIDAPLPDGAGIVGMGRELRHHAHFQPSGTNVDFVTVEGEDLVRIRTYERGVEDETWACGTGAVAAAMIHSLLRGGEGDRSIGVIPLSGEKLVVRFQRSGAGFSRVTLEGPAVVTFTGSFDGRIR